MGGIYMSNEVFQTLPTTAVSDALKGKNHLPSTIKVLDARHHIAGKAVTVKLPIYENGAVMEAMLRAEPGDILVVDIENNTSRAVAGDFVIGMMKKLGIGGLVVNGAIRDVEAVLALDFPVFVTGITPAAGVKNGGGKVNIPVTIGKTTVQPGDIIVGDVNGVVVVPQEAALEVAARAKEKIVQDEERERTVTASRESIIAHLTKVTDSLKA